MKLKDAKPVLPTEISVGMMLENQARVQNAIDALVQEAFGIVPVAPDSETIATVETELSVGLTLGDDDE